jgi:predicted AAA+ superfamily ATPase
MYWRTAAGEEVDFVVEWRGQLLPIEIKATTRPTTADARHLRSFRAEHPKLSRAGLLLHTGTEITQLADGIIAAPWWRVI